MIGSVVQEKKSMQQDKMCFEKKAFKVILKWSIFKIKKKILS